MKKNRSAWAQLHWPGAALLAIAAMVPSAVARAQGQLDVLIKNGTVYDGTGQPGRLANIGILDGHIVFVARARVARARIVIDVQGLAVAPGFIDVHNHMLDEVAHSPGPELDQQFLTQGVTTVVFGPDGALNPADIRQRLKTLAVRGSGTNYACYVGHGGIRSAVLKDQRRAPTAQELEQMEAQVREGMELGCVGLSTGLMYEPGMFSTTREVVSLAKEVKPFHGTYDSHTRDPVAQMVVSEQEAIDIGAAAGIPAKLAHLKAVGEINKGHIGDVISIVETARASGREVVADQYPYDGAMTLPLQDILGLPTASADGHVPVAIARLELDKIAADPSKYRNAHDVAMNGAKGGFSWIRATRLDSMRIVSAPGSEGLINQNLARLAVARKQDPFDLIVDLIKTTPSEILITLGSIDDADIDTLIKQPWVMIASDGGPLRVIAHPRSTGTFPRVLGHYVRDRKILTLEDAVRKMTALPADHLGLTDRGRLSPGMIADITVFDPSSVTDVSTYVHPQLLSRGIIDVLVNGQFALRDSKVTGVAAGSFARRQR